MNNLYDSIYKSIINSCILTIGLIIVFSIIPVVIINAIVVKPLRDGVKLATSIADKDLSLAISSKSEDEVGSIIHSIEQAKNNLKDIISEAQSSSTEVTSASEILYLSLDNIISKTQHMTGFVDDMNKNVQENINTINEANAKYRRNCFKSEKSEKMTTDIEEQMSEFEEINTISNELENMAVNLTALVNEFKIIG